MKSINFLKQFEIPYRKVTIVLIYDKEKDKLIKHPMNDYNNYSIEQINANEGEWIKLEKIKFRLSNNLKRYKEIKSGKSKGKIYDAKILKALDFKTENIK